MNVKHKNGSETFRLLVSLGSAYDGENFTIVFSTGKLALVKYICSFDGTTYTNCEKVDDTHILCTIDNAGFGDGMLVASITVEYEDSKLEDGTYEVGDTRLVEALDENNVPYHIMITQGASDPITTPEIVWNLLGTVLKGDKGDAFTYDDFTEEQIEGLKQPAYEGKADAEAAAKEALDAAASVSADHEQAEKDHTQAVADTNQAASDHSTASNDHTQASSDHTQAVADTNLASSDHSKATSDHTQAVADTNQAATDHSTASSDHTQAVADSKQAASDHSTASTDHTQAVADSKQAATDHSTASTDHTQAVADTKQAATDHSTASSDHTQAVADTNQAASDHTTATSDHAIVAGYNSRLENVETETTDLALEMNTKADETDFAPLFDATKTYTYGDMVTYNGELYSCKNPSGHTGAWVESDFVQKSLADILPSYCRKDGLYPNLTAGMAQGLVGDGTATSKKVLAYQFSDDDNLSPYSSGVPSFSIKGRSIAWRQMVDNGSDAGGDGPTIGGTYEYNSARSKKNKPYLIHAQTSDGEWDWKVVFVSEEQTYAAAVATAFGFEQKVVADSESVMGSKCFDLLLAFGIAECQSWGTDQTTLLKTVAQLWGFASFDDFAGGKAKDGTTLINTQWEYLTTYKADGELISTKIPSVIRSYDKDGNLVAEREVPDSVLQAFPDGILRQAGSVYDEINEDVCVKRVGVVDLGSFTWNLNRDYGYYSLESINAKPYFSNGIISNCLVSNFVAGSKSVCMSATNLQLISWVNSNKAQIVVSTDITKYPDAASFKAAMSGVLFFYELATPIETSLSTPLSIQSLDSETLLTFAPSDTTEPYAPAQLDMSIDRDYAAIVKELAIKAGIWN